MPGKKKEEIVFIHGKTINLRPPLRSDLPFIIKWLNDPVVGQYLLGRLYPIGESEKEKWLDDLPNRKNALVFIIVERTGNRPIGFTGIYLIDWRDRHGESATLIGEEKYREKGYGTEAKMLALRHFFHTMNLHKVSSQVIATNERSKAVNRKCGYAVEGILRKHIYKDGEYRDILQMAVFRDDWLKAWKPFAKQLRLPP